MTFFGYISPESRDDLSSLWRLLSMYKGRITLAASTMFLTVLLQLPLPFLTMVVIDRLFKERDMGLFPLICAGMLAFVLFSSAVVLAHTLILALLREHVLGRLQLDVVDRLQRTTVSFFYTNHSSYLSTRIRSDLRNIQSLLAGPLLATVQNILLFAGGLVSMFILDFKLTLVTLAILPVFALTIFLFNKRIRAMSLIVQELSAQYGSRLQESLASIHLIKAFSLERENYQRLRCKLVHLVESTFRQEMLGSLARRSTYVLSIIAPLAVLWFGASEFLAGRISIGKFVAFQAILSYVFTPTQMLLNQNVQIQSALVSLRRLMELLHLPQESVPRVARPLSGRWDVQAQSVSFGYRQEHEVLSGLELSISEGEKVALVGPSGEGKTTFLRLLLRFHDPQEGNIYIGGVDIREMSLDEIRSNIAVVFQEPHLLSGTIEENLRYGNLLATPEQVYEAAKLAEAHEFILDLHKGYQTVLGEAGVTLSAGQKMRLAIARAVLKNAPIVLLDEPTSALDRQTEQAVLDNLREHLQGRTVLIISHQPSLVQIADRVCTMKGGKIVEEFSPRAFLSQSGLEVYGGLAIGD